LAAGAIIHSLESEGERNKKKKLKRERLEWRTDHAT
jgi:hypothetical protein